MSDAFELEICQGKYRYRYEAGKQEVWRNGYIWQTLNGKLIGDKFVFSLAVELDEALKECGELRAKIAEMERQVPICRAEDLKHAESLLPTLGLKPENPLYALPGAQPAPSVPEGWTLVPIEPTPTMVKAGLESSHVLNVHRVLVCYDAMIDAAPEAKP